MRRHRRDHPGARIVVTGCAAQIDPSSWQGMAEVDAVIGNHEKLDPATWTRLAGRNADETMVAVGDIMTVRETAPHLLEGLIHRIFCRFSNFSSRSCTFCIIPYGRGNNRSVPMAVIIDQVARLADSGIAEVVLTGVDITSWGSDFEGNQDGKTGLGLLVREILAQVPGLPQLRLSSIDPSEIDVIDIALAENDRRMPHLHLSGTAW